MRWAQLLLKIPGNWMTKLVENHHDINIRVLSCMPYKSNGGRGLMRLGSKNLSYYLNKIRHEQGVVSANFSRVSEKSAFGEVVVDKCAACTALNKSSCFMISSKSRADGWLEWAVAADSNSLIYDLLDLLGKKACEVQLLRISSSNWALTQRQEEILWFAFNNGYFEYPRRISLRELSLVFDVSPSTMSEILRAGQRRIFNEYFSSA